MKLKETDLFYPVKEFLEDKGFTVYSEVEGPEGNRADILALDGSLSAIVELKTSLTVDLICQAIRWLGYANYVYIAVPKTKSGHWQAKRILEKFGIGLIEVTFASFSFIKNEKGFAMCCYYPTFFRKCATKWREYITENHKNNPPGGSNAGGYTTPYKRTIENVRGKLELWSKYDNGKWHSISEILEHCTTHYSNPKAGLVNALLKIENDWCESSKINGKLHFRFKKGGCENAAVNQ